MKKLLVGLVSMLLMLCIAGCSSGGDTTDDTTATDTTEESASKEPASEGDLDGYYVSIGDCLYDTNEEGNRVIIVNFDFTNNSEEATSFDVAVMAKAYQDGIEIEPAYGLRDSESAASGAYDADGTMRNVQPGATLTVQEAYLLSNDTSDIMIEATPLISFEDVSITKTFSQQ